MHRKLQCPAEAVGPIQLMLLPTGERLTTEPSQFHKCNPWVTPRCGHSAKSMPHQHACKPCSARYAVFQGLCSVSRDMSVPKQLQERTTSRQPSSSGCILLLLLRQRTSSRQPAQAQPSSITSGRRPAQSARHAMEYLAPPGVMHGGLDREQGLRGGIAMSGMLHRGAIAPCWALMPARRSQSRPAWPSCRVGTLPAKACYQACEDRGPPARPTQLGPTAHACLCWQS